MSYGTKVVDIYSMVNLTYNDTTDILSVGPSDGLTAGTYFFSGNWAMKANPGVTINNKHADVGLLSSSIDTAPAGGSSYGDHINVPGDSNELTFVYPTGSRIITVNGTQTVYLHIISAWTPSSAAVVGCGALNWLSVSS